MQPRPLFFKIGFWVRFYANLTHMGLYSRGTFIIQGELNKLKFCYESSIQIPELFYAESYDSFGVQCTLRNLEF